MVLLVAGFDTTSTTLSYLVYQLAKEWIIHLPTAFGSVRIQIILPDPDPSIKFEQMIVIKIFKKTIKHFHKKTCFI